MAVPVSIDGKSILTLYYSTLHKVHKSKQNFYLNHPKDLHDLNITDNVDCASLALPVAPVSYYCLKKIIGLRPKLGNTYYHITLSNYDTFHTYTFNLIDSIIDYFMHG